MEATAVVALTLALLQVADHPAEEMYPNRQMVDLLLGSGMVALVVTFVGLPLAIIFLRGIDLAAGWAITIAFVVLFTIGLAITVMVTGGGNDVVRMLANVSLGLSVLFGFQALALTLLRLYGWRLAGWV